VLKWGLAPLVIAVSAGAVGRMRSSAHRNEIEEAIAALPATQRQELESVPARVVANATWAFGDLASVKKMVRAELDRLPDPEDPRRARVLIRFGIVDTNPEGQAAVFSAACAADASICDHLEEAALREVRLRSVAPGNRLPVFFSGAHSRLAEP
jgi:hypothetical protein